MRYAIELSYNGTTYCGWQEQPNAPSVQAELELALTKLNGNKEIKVVGCGRTDTGVHASYYIAHTIIDKEIDRENTVYKLNKILSENIVIHSMQVVSDDFHARFSAVSRTYHYFLNQEKSAFLPNSLYLPQALDFEAMNSAAKHLIGTKDFTSLSKLHTDVKTNICTVTQAEWIQLDRQWCFVIQADRFLRNMVRATVGTLLDIGLGKTNENELQRILEAMDRGEAGLSVPANGLFLADVKYPENLFQRKQLA